MVAQLEERTFACPAENWGGGLIENKLSAFMCWPNIRPTKSELLVQRRILLLVRRVSAKWSDV